MTCAIFLTSLLRLNEVKDINICMKLYEILFQAFQLGIKIIIAAFDEKYTAILCAEAIANAT